MGPKFQPGDWALHKGGHLDARQVTEVSDDKKSIKIFILTEQTDWLLASNYDNLGQ